MSDHLNDSLLSTARAENLIRHMKRDLDRGSTPQIDFRSFRHFDLGALLNLLAFISAAREGRLTPQRSVPPLPMALPETEEAYDFLLKMRFFSFTRFSQGGVGEIIRNATVIAEKENKINSRRRLDSRFPYMPLRVIVRKYSAYANRIDFESDCKHFSEWIQRIFYRALIDHLRFNEEKAKDFWYPNREVVENIYLHSGSWGIGAIQCYRDSILICYADIGKARVRSALFASRPNCRTPGGMQELRWEASSRSSNLGLDENTRQ